MASPKEYKLVLTKDDDTTVTFGNATGETKAFNIVHNKKDRTSILTFSISNKNDEYTNEFLLKDRNVELFVKIDGISFSKRFGGDITEVDPDSNNTRLEFLCLGRDDILNYRYWTGVASNIDLGQHIKNVLNEKAPEIDTSTINVSTGEIFDEIKSDAETLGDHFDGLFRENTYKLDISPDNVVTLFDENKGASGITLIQSNILGDKNKLIDSKLSYKNKVTVIGGNEKFIDFDEPQFTWNTGDQKVFILENPVESLTWVKFAGSIQTIDTDFTLGNDKKTITMLTVANGNTVDVRYDYFVGVWWSEQVLGSKAREFVIKDPTIITQSRAERVALNSLANRLIEQTKGNVASGSIVTEFEWFETLIINLPRFSSTNNIVGFTETIDGDYVVVFELSQILDDNARKIRDLANSINKLSEFDITTSILKDGIFLEDFYNEEELLEGFEVPIGTRFFWDISNWDDGKTWDTGEGTEIQFL